GPERFQVENFIAHGEGGRNTRLLGFMQDVRGVLSASDIFVLPTRGEGFPLAVAEAMAAGLPVIASDVPGLAEVLDNGRAGMVFETNQAFALADAIEKLAGDADLRTHLAQAGRQRVIEQFTLDANIAAHEQLYEEVATSRRETIQTESKGGRE
ncbi:MAG: glycosyltransferase, partial [Planctomycetaceae bacterium]